MVNQIKNWNQEIAGGCTCILYAASLHDALEHNVNTIPKKTDDFQNAAACANASIDLRLHQSVRVQNLELCVFHNRAFEYVRVWVFCVVEISHVLDLPVTIPPC